MDTQVELSGAEVGALRSMLTTPWSLSARELRRDRATMTRLVELGYVTRHMHSVEPQYLITDAGREAYASHRRALTGVR